MSVTTRTEAERPPLDALAGAMLLASLGASIATVALPTLAEAFSAPVSGVQWIIVAYLMSVTITIVLAGRFGDLFGHGRVLIAGLGIFTFASILCAAAPTLGTLIAARAVQGVGGAILMALPISIVRNTVEGGRVGSAMGLLGTMSAIGTALGPSLGGIVIAASGWRVAFVLLAGLGVVAFWFALRTLPQTAPAEARSMDRRIDWPGAVLLAVTLAAFALATGGGKVDAGWDAGWLLAIAILGLVLFVAAEARAAAPLVPVSVLRDRATGAALATNLLASAVMMSTLVVGPFFLSFGLGLNAALVGLVMAVGPVTAALAGIPAGRATDRFGARRVLAFGLADMMVGLICLALLPRVLGVAGYVAALIVLTPGFQLFLAANNTAVMANVGEKQRGVLSGLLGLSRNLGFMTGASMMTTFFAVSVGTEEITEAPAQAVAGGFTATFVLAAGMTLMALVLTYSGRTEARAKR